MVQFRQEDLPHEQYVFFYIDVFGHSLGSKQRQPWARGDEDDAIAKEAFQVREFVNVTSQRGERTQGEKRGGVCSECRHAVNG